MIDPASDIDGAKQALADRRIEIAHHTADITALYFGNNVKSSERIPLLRGILTLAGVDTDDLKFHLSALVDLNKPVILNAYAPDVYERIIRGLGIIGADAVSTADFAKPATNLCLAISADKALLAPHNEHIVVRS